MKQDTESFEAKTVLVPMPEGIRVIANIAPQINIVVVVSIEQVKQALQVCLNMRTEQEDNRQQIIRAIK